MNRGAHLRPLLVAAMLIPALAACAKSGSSGGGADPSALTGTVWRLSDASMASLVPSVWPGSQVTIEFKGGQVSGVSA